MKSIKIINKTKNKVIASKGSLANNFVDRLKGLLGKKILLENEGMCIKPCKIVHTLFMKFPIDVIFIDKFNKVDQIVEGLEPYNISPYNRNAEFVIEITAFKSKRQNIQIGDEINIIKNSITP